MKPWNEFLGRSKADINFNFAMSSLDHCFLWCKKSRFLLKEHHQLLKIAHNIAAEMTNVTHNK